jgi:hypothetical protein
MDPLTTGPAYLVGRVVGAVAVLFLVYRGYRRLRGDNSDDESGN